ncbi:MAG: glycosyltransferase [Lentisphaerae bacterium]|nr:glycosyltransferase [Lentisphaerota bacterium]
MTEKKLRQKISPIQALSSVVEIVLVRREPFEGSKIVCFSVPRVLRRCVLTVEAWRLLTVLWLGVTRRPDVAVGMTLVGHCVHVYMLKLFLRIPAVFHIMGKQDLQLHDPTRVRRQRLLWKFALRGDVLVTRGQRTLEMFVREGGMPGERVFVQQNVFDFGLYAPDDSVKKQYDVVYVGFLDRYKSVDRLLDAIEVASRDRPVPRSLALVGDGSERDTLVRRAKDLGIAAQVRFLGTLDEPALVAILQRSRVFAMTSLGEGLPQAMIEAMACGLPCVLFDDADIGDVVRSGENGILVPPGDLDRFAGEISRLLDDPEHYERIAAGAARVRDEYADAFSLDAQANVWRRIFHVALGNATEEDADVGKRGSHE